MKRRIFLHRIFQCPVRLQWQLSRSAHSICARDNEVTIRWVPAQSGATDNEVADRYEKSGATGGASVEEAPVEEIPVGFTNETSLSHMTGVASEAKSPETAEWIAGHVRPERR